MTCFFLVFFMDRLRDRDSSLTHDDEDDVSKQLNKRFKNSKKEVINTIASSINAIAETTESMNYTHTRFLQVNRNLVTFLLDLEKRREQLDLGSSESATTSEQPSENTPSL